MNIQTKINNIRKQLNVLNTWIESSIHRPQIQNAHHCDLQMQQSFESIIKTQQSLIENLLYMNAQRIAHEQFQEEYSQILPPKPQSPSPIKQTTPYTLFGWLKSFINPCPEVVPTSCLTTSEIMRLFETESQV